MLEAIGGAVAALKTAGEMAGSFVELRDTALIQGKVIELQSVILSAQGSALAAQSEQLTLLEQKRQLEAQIARLEAWDTEKRRYSLQEIAPGSVAYILKPDAQGTELAHPVCCNCFEQGKISHLIPANTRVMNYRIFKCWTCGLEAPVDQERLNERPKPQNPEVPDFGAV